MIEAGVVITGGEPPGSRPLLFWHLPDGRTGGSIPDSRKLWNVLWDLRKEMVLQFAHSHPGSGIPSPSHTDLTTFAAVEAGLGRRVIWWITSSDCLVQLYWSGEIYDSMVWKAAEPDWVDQLRKRSEG